MRYPAMQIRGPADKQAARQQLTAARNAALLIFVSANAVRYAFPLLPEQLPLDIDIAAVGSATARALSAVGLDPTLVPERMDSEGLLALPTLHDVTGRSVVILRGNGGRELLFETLRDDPDPFGGNVLIEGSAELLFPLPFIKDRSQLRSAFFVDVGNVFNTQCSASQINCFDVDPDELRYSVGVGVTWITGFGPMTFSLAKPLNSGDFDEEEVFQFTLGRGF